MCLGIENSVVYCANDTKFFIIPLVKGNTSCNSLYFIIFTKFLGMKCETKELENFFVDILLCSSITKWILDALEFLRQIRILFSTCNYSAKPQKMGCVRTLDSITLENFTEGFIGQQTIQQIAKRLLLNNNLIIFKTFLRYGVQELKSFENSSINVSYIREAYLVYSIAESILSKANKKRQKLISLYLQSLDVLANIELSGIQFDESKCDAIQNFILHKMNKLEEQIFNESGEQFNLNKAADISRVFFYIVM